MKKISIILAALLLGGCAVTQINENYEQILLKEDASADIKINREWWTGYGEARLNELISLALKNNIDLAKSAIAVNKA